jgi:hypothetical protein
MALAGFDPGKKGGTMSSYTHVPHPHTLERIEHRDKPVKTTDVLRAKVPAGSMHG